MSSIDSTDPHDVQFLVQRYSVGGIISCRGYGGLPPGPPGLVLIASGASATSIVAADALVAALDSYLLSLSVAVTRATVPCHGQVPNASAKDCRAHEDPACHKLLVVIGEAGANVSPDPLFDWWISQGPLYAILPLLPNGADVSESLPPRLRGFNVGYWAKSPGERVDAVIALLGMVPEDRRVFVSYVRAETTELAEQLFEVLEKHRFDVFVDRFRVPPGVDFQERLEDELAHKSMILVLESASILTRQWVEVELAFAKKHELGRLAVHLPGGARAPWIDDEYRVSIQEGQVAPPLPDGEPISNTHRLTGDAINHVLQRLVEEHSRSLLRRKFAMLDDLRVALSLRGVVDQRVDRRGHLHVSVPANGVRREYVVWSTPRPPEVDDFRTAHGICGSGTKPVGAVVTPSIYRERRKRESHNWLAERSLVQLRDIGRLGEIADLIAAGADI